MAATRSIEYESGVYDRRAHPHNGYYAGDFSPPRAPRGPAALVGSLSGTFALLPGEAGTVLVWRSGRRSP